MMVGYGWLSRPESLRRSSRSSRRARSISSSTFLPNHSLLEMSFPVEILTVDHSEIPPDG